MPRPASQHARPLAAALLIGAALAALAPSPAAAQASYYARLSVQAQHGMTQSTDDSVDSDFFETQLGTPPGRVDLHADSDHDPLSFHAIASGWLDVRTAGIHAVGYSQSVNNVLGQRMFGITSASGLVSDNFRLNVAGAAAGAVFTVTAQVRMEGSAWTLPPVPPPGASSLYTISATANWSAYARVQRPGVDVRVDAGEDCRMFSSLGTGVCTTNGTPGLATLSFTMVNGGGSALLLLGASLDARTTSWAQAALPPELQSGADMGHTLAWGGVVSLRDASGALVGGDWSLLSDSSGFDYRQAYAAPVPEPGAGALGLAGLAALVGLVRRRARSAG